MLTLNTRRQYLRAMFRSIRLFVDLAILLLFFPLSDLQRLSVLVIRVEYLRLW